MPKQAAASSARVGVKRATKSMKTAMKKKGPMKAMKANTPMKAMKALKVMKAKTPMKAMKAMKAMKDDGAWKVKDCANLRMARLPECELKRRFSESMDAAYVDFQDLLHFNRSYREPPPCTWRALLGRHRLPS